MAKSREFNGKELVGREVGVEKMKEGGVFNVTGGRVVLNMTVEVWLFVDADKDVKLLRTVGGKTKLEPRGSDETKVELE